MQVGKLKLQLTSVALVCAASVAIAETELSERQTAVLELLTPVIQMEVEGDTGVSVATCVVLNAKGRELRKMAKAEAGTEPPDQVLVDNANVIMQRPEMMTCLTEALSK